MRWIAAGSPHDEADDLDPSAAHSVDTPPAAARQEQFSGVAMELAEGDTLKSVEKVHSMP
jgi:hypothetical protein